MGRLERRLKKFIFASLWQLATLPFRIVFKLLIWIFSGESQKSDGYVLKTSSMGTPQFEHRMVAEAILGRRLVRGEVVHHINGRRDDNRPANLCVMSRTNHDRYHVWYDWVRRTYGRYPGRETQLKKLRQKFGGVILDEAEKSKRMSA